MKKLGLFLFYLWTMTIVVVYFLPAQLVWAAKKAPRQTHSLHHAGGNESRQKPSKTTGSKRFKRVPNQGRNLVDKPVSMLEDLIGPTLETKTTGLASWYYLPGNDTKSGEPFRSNSSTVAHNSFPVGTILEVTCLLNGKTRRMRVNDHMPKNALVYEKGKKGKNRPIGVVVIDIPRDTFREFGDCGTKTGHYPIAYRIIHRPPPG